MSRYRLAVFCMLAGLLPVAALAQPAPYYKGKTLYLDIGPGTAGGGYDIAGRFLARHLGRHLPGNPSIVARNVEGGSGLLLANQLYAVSPRDGTVVGMIADNAIFLELLTPQAVRYRSAEFNWIGRLATAVDLTVTWHDSKVKTVADAKTISATIAAGPTGGLAYHLPALLNGVVGTQFKIITGYNGVIPMQLAMERGETEGAFAEWSAFKLVHGDWLRDKKVNLIVQYALERDPELADVPTALELGATEADRQLLTIASVGPVMGRTLIAPPGVPAELVKLLRDGFAAALADPELLAEAKQMQLFMAPMRGEALQDLVTRFMRTPPEVMERARQILATK